MDMIAGGGEWDQDTDSCIQPASGECSILKICDKDENRKRFTAKLKHCHIILIPVIYDIFIIIHIFPIH